LRRFLHALQLTNKYIFSKIEKILEKNDTFTDTCHIFVDERLQLFYLRSELSDKFHIRVFVDSRLVYNIFRTIGISKSTESVVVIAFCRTDSRYHDGLGVAA